MFLCEPEDNVWERRMGLVLGFSLEVTFHRFFFNAGEERFIYCLFFFWRVCKARISFPTDLVNDEKVAILTH